MALSSTSRPGIRGRVIPRVPATLQATGGLAVSKENGTWTFRPDFSQLGINVSVSDAENEQLWLYNAATDSYSRMTVQALIDEVPAGPTGPTGAAGPSYAATSTSSVAIASSGSKAFTTQAGLAYSAGARVRVSDAAAPTTNWMEGVVTAYSSTTLTFTADRSLGSGTLTSWTINLAGQPGASGAGSGDLLSTNNLSDVTSAATARSNLGVAFSNTRLAKTANYTLLTADRDNTIALGGSACFTLTVGAASGFDANFFVRIVNEDTGRGKILAINGYSSFFLWPGQYIDLFNQNNTWRFQRERWRATGTITFYVNHADGDNANDGLSTGAGNALATIQEGVNRVSQELDCNGYPPAIQIANATFTEDNVSVTYRLHGSHVFVIRGDHTTPGNCIWQVSPGAAALTCRDYSGAWLDGVRIVSTGSGSVGVSSSQHGILDLENVEFGAFAGGYPIESTNGGSVGYVVGGTTKFLGNCAYLWRVTSNSTLLVTGCTINLSAITFTAGLSMALNGSAVFSGVTFTGSGAGSGSTGKKYEVEVGSSASLGGLTLPGASAGTNATGYVV